MGRSGLRFARLPALALAAGIGALPAAAAGAALSISDIRKSHPHALAAYREIVPLRFGRVPWIASLLGVGGPVQAVAGVGGRRFLGSICQPHDCADNKVAYLLNADGSRAVALVRSRRRTHGRELALGSPDAGEMALLRRALAP